MAYQKTYKPSTAQIRAIWALGKRLGMDSEGIHGIAWRIAQVDSLKLLTPTQAGRMIEELKQRAGLPSTFRKGGGEGRLTAQQRRKIFVLTRELGWHDQPERANGFIRKVTGVDNVQWLTPQQASLVITAMSRMRDGGYGERAEPKPSPAGDGG